MARHKDTVWNLPEGNPTHPWVSIHAALLMDIRDELKSINTSLLPLRCINFQRIPGKLDQIATNTKKRKPGPKPKSP